MSRTVMRDVPPVPPSGDRPRRSVPPSGGTPPSRWKTVLPFVLGALLIVLGIGFGALAARMVSTRETNIVKAAISWFVPTPESVFGKDRIYVLLLGLDYDYTDQDQEYSSHSRTDTIMAAGLDFPSKTMKLVSVLRDTGVQLNGHTVKINQAYSDGGVKLSDKVIGGFLGMPPNPNGSNFDRYIIVNSNGLKEFIDAIGGIDVPVTETMNYDDNWGHLHIHFKPGLVHMNGTQAMGYSRFRHDACSDPCRTKRQQQVIHITIAKLKGEKLNDLAHIGALIAALNKNVKTNLTFDEEKSLAWAFKDSNIQGFKSDTIGYVDTEPSEDGEALVIDEKQKAALVSELLGPYVTATPPPQSALQAVKPSTIHIVIQNGSGVSGLAGVVSAKLKKAGYVIDSVGNADAFSYETTQIRPASKVPFAGERVRMDLGLPAATVTPATDATPGPGAVVTVIVGKDFALAQTAAAAATPSAAPNQ